MTGIFILNPGFHNIRSLSIHLLLTLIANMYG